MAEIILTKIDRPVLTYEDIKYNIETSYIDKFVTTTSGSENIILSGVTNTIVVEKSRQDNIVLNTVDNVINLNGTFSDNSIVELLIRDIIASNPSVLSANSSAAKIENLTILKDIEQDKYFVTTTSDIEGDLMTLMINYNDEHLDVIGNINIVGKRRVEFMSDIDVAYMRARVTYIKKI